MAARNTGHRRRSQEGRDRSAWNARQLQRGRYDASGEDASLAHQDRWAENYLRHECIDYETALAQLHGRCGKDEAYELLRRRVDEMIRTRFPTLGAVPEKRPANYPREKWERSLKKAMQQALGDEAYHQFRATRADGPYSVEAFREDVLKPKLLKAVETNKKLIVNLDGRKYRYPCDGFIRHSRSSRTISAPKPRST